MFANAFIVGPDDGPGLALERLAQDVGFRNVSWLTDLAEAEESTKSIPTCFFLFTPDLNLKDAAEASKVLRASRNRQIKFAPLVGFCPEPTEASIRAYMSMGVDDILISPFTVDQVQERTRCMIGRKVVFFETKQYFGPDRRRDAGLKDLGHKMRGSGGDHRRIEILRDLNVGVKVLSDQQFKEQSKATERDFSKFKRQWA